MEFKLINQEDGVLIHPYLFISTHIYVKRQHKYCNTLLNSLNRDILLLPRHIFRTYINLNVQLKEVEQVYDY